MRDSTDAQTSDIEDAVATKKKKSKAKRTSGPSGKNLGFLMTLRVPQDGTREQLKDGADREGKTFNQWAIDVLKDRAGSPLPKRRG